MATVQHHSHLYGVLWNAKVDVKSSFCYPCRWSEVNQVSWPFECLKWAVIVRVAAHSPRYSWNPHRRASVLIVMKPTSTPTQLNPIWHLITNSLYCSLQRRCTTHTASYFIHTHTRSACYTGTSRQFQRTHSIAHPMWLRNWHQFSRKVVEETNIFSSVRSMGLIWQT